MKWKIFFLIVLFFIMRKSDFSLADNTEFLHISELIKVKKYTEAEKELSKLNQFENRYVVNVISADISFVKGDFNKAEGYYTKALEINPLGIDPKIGIAKVHAARKDINKAKEMLHEAIKINPHAIRIYYELGFILEASEDIKEATESFEKGLEKYFLRK